MWGEIAQFFSTIIFSPYCGLTANECLFSSVGRTFLKNNLGSYLLVTMGCLKETTISDKTDICTLCVSEIFGVGTIKWCIKQTS